QAEKRDEGNACEDEGRGDDGGRDPIDRFAAAFVGDGDHKGGDHIDQAGEDRDDGDVEAAEGDEADDGREDDRGRGDDPGGRLGKLLRGQFRGFGDGGVCSGHSSQLSFTEFLATMARATMFARRVMTKSTRPTVMSSDRRRPAASGKFCAISEAMVWLPLTTSEAVRTPGERIMATAMVSPSARPSPSMVAETMRDLPKGSTAMRIISQRVAPRARAASSCRRGVWRKISRVREVMIGRIMIDRTSEAVRSVRPVCDTEPSAAGAKIGIHPNHFDSHR